jgi:hypothetical protein
MTKLSHRQDLARSVGSPQSSGLIDYDFKNAAGLFMKYVFFFL